MTGWRLLAALALWGSLSSCGAAAPDLAAGFLDSLELDAVQYSVVIDSHPVKVGQEIEEVQGDPAAAGRRQDGAQAPPPAQIITMTNKFGQKYRCLLPDISDLIADKEGPNEGTDPHGNADEDKTSTGSSTTFVQEIRSLLAPLGEAQCLFRTKDWWTYEFCYGKTIRQYHMEDGKPSGKILNLGMYNNDYEWPEESGKEGMGSASSTSSDPTPKHHSQFYTNGTECDLTGNMRKTEVKFHCDPDSKVEYVGQVDEPLSCEYVINIYTSRICSLSAFKPPPEPKPKEIRCHPMLNEEEYVKFEAYERERKKLEELNRQKAKNLRKQQMLELVGEDEDLAGVDVDSDEGYRMVEKKFEERLADRLVQELGSMLTPEALQGLSEAGASGGSVLAVHKFFSDEDFRGGRRAVDVAGGKSEFMKIVKETAEARRSRKMLERFSETAKKLLGDEEEDEEEENAKGAAAMDDQDMDRKVRSDVVTEDDLIKEYGEKVNGMSQEEQNRMAERAKDKEFQEKARSELRKSLEDIIAESEKEVGAKLDLDGRQEAQEAAEDAANLEEMWKKMQKIEERISKVNSDLGKVQGILEEAEAELAREVAEGEDYAGEEEVTGLDYDLAGAEDPVAPERDPVTGERLHYKHDGGRSVKKELREEDYDVSQGDEEEEDELRQKGAGMDSGGKSSSTTSTPFQEDAAAENVQVKVTDMSPQKIAGLKNAASADRVTKRLESVIKTKLSQAGLDTGGRQIEVKLVTANPYDTAGVLGGGEGAAAAGVGAEADDMGPREAQQFQDMIFNLITGNQEGYNDIDAQRKSERNYKFQWDDKLLKSAEEKVKDVAESLEGNKEHSASEDEVGDS